MSGSIDPGALPDRAIESFAGAGNPLALRPLQPGEHVLDVGCGAGFDAFVAAGQVGPAGQVIGIDITPEMVAKAQATAGALGLRHAGFRDGFAESLPAGDGWADVVISNGTINLCPGKRTVFAEIHRVLRPGGALQLADVANGTPSRRWLASIPALTSSRSRTLRASALVPGSPAAGRAGPRPRHRRSRRPVRGSAPAFPPRQNPTTWPACGSNSAAAPTLYWPPKPRKCVPAPWTSPSSGQLQGLQLIAD